MTQFFVFIVNFYTQMHFKIVTSINQNFVIVQFVNFVVKIFPNTFESQLNVNVTTNSVFLYSMFDIDETQDLSQLINLRLVNKI